jgi:hypothetical protein
MWWWKIEPELLEAIYKEHLDQAKDDGNTAEKPTLDSLVYLQNIKPPLEPGSSNTSMNMP